MSVPLVGGEDVGWGEKEREGKGEGGGREESEDACTYNILSSSIIAAGLITECRVFPTAHKEKFMCVSTTIQLLLMS